MAATETIPADHLSREIARPVAIGSQFIIFGIAWSILVFAAMGFDMWNTRQKNLEASLLQARISLEKDILFRTWNTLLGGLSKMPW